MTQHVRRIGTLLLLAAACLYTRQAAGQAPLAAPDRPLQVMLIRNTLIAVNHGNLTGNYTVLRDLASERFRQRHNASDLAATFGNLKQQKLDLSPILVIEPQLTQQPGEVSPGRLQLVGVIPTRPQEVQFGLLFQRVEGGWMIDEIELRVAPAATPTQNSGPARPAEPTASGYRLPAPNVRPPDDYRAAERNRPSAPPPAKLR